MPVPTIANPSSDLVMDCRLRICPELGQEGCIRGAVDRQGDELLRIARKNNGVCHLKRHESFSAITAWSRAVGNRGLEVAINGEMSTSIAGERQDFGLDFWGGKHLRRVDSVLA